MDQITLGLEPLPKKTRKEIFLAEMNQVVPWATLVKLIQPHARGAHQALGGRPPFPIETMLRIHCLQLWWNLSDPAMEEELHERPLYRRFVGLEGAARMPDETTILRFGKTPSPRHLLEKQQLAPQVLATINAGLAQQGLMLKTGTVVDATIIAAPSSTKNKDGERDPEMHQTKKGNQWHFGVDFHATVIHHFHLNLTHPGS
jgi:IS5 family transposase